MEQELPQAELLRRIRHALDTMDELPRAVFDRYRYRDLDYGRIAEELRISVAEVERHMAAAMLHSHVLVRGRDDRGKDLIIAREYMLRCTNESGGP